MIKIGIIGLIKDINIGDAIIGDCVKYLFSKNNKTKAKLIDLKGRTDRKSIYKLLGFFAFRIDNKKNLKLKEYQMSPIMKLYLKIYFYTQLNGLDLIVYDGGGLIECEHYNCDIFINFINKIALKKHIKIAYNAMGFNGDFNQNNKRYISLKENLNLKNVISVTVRENLDEMNNNYLESKKAYLIADPAVWSCDCYGIERKESKIIGINVIRPNIFDEFNNDISEDYLLDYFCSIIKKLDDNGYSWQLFTNGTLPDYNFGQKILQKLGISNISEKLLRRPLTGKQFLEDLSGFCAVICSRMHATICSYSLKIPTVAIKWNPKQSYFYENIGYPDRCMDIEKTKSDVFFDRFVHSISEGYREDSYTNFKNTVVTSIEKIVTMMEE